MKRIRRYERSAWNRAAAAFMGVLLCQSAFAADDDATALAKAAQNPVADMASLPFQWNTNYNYGPLDRQQQVLNIQPVYPINLNSEWNLITRTIVPVISQPPFTPSQDRINGIGDVQFSAFFSPAKPTASGWIWGAGPIVQLDTATNDRLGQGKYALGPTAVALRVGKEWVTGALINQVWSVAGDDDRADVSQMLIQPFINYNFPHSPGRYLSFSPIITANWEAEYARDVWTVPLGLGIGQIMRFGKQPVNLQLSYYTNVEKPDFGPDYQVRFQLVFLFPKGS